MASRSEVWLLTPSGVVNSRPSQNQRVSRRFLPTSTRHVSQRLISNIVNEPLTLASSPIRFLDLPGIPNTPLTYIGTLSNAADPTGATRRRAFLHLARPEPPPKHSSKHPTLTRVATDLLGQNSGHLLKENQQNRGGPYPPPWPPCLPNSSRQTTFQHIIGISTAPSIMPISPKGPSAPLLSPTPSSAAFYPSSISPSRTAAAHGSTDLASSWS